MALPAEAATAEERALGTALGRSEERALGTALGRSEDRATGTALGRALLLLGGLVAAGFCARSLGVEILSGAPPTGQGAALLFGGGALLTAAGLPRQALAFAGGYAFGAWHGGALALAAQTAGCLIDFWWARLVARDWAIRRLRGRMARAHRFLTTRPFSATLTFRLLPVGNNLALNLLAGVSGVRAAPFLAASVLGYLPQTAIFALAGSGVHVDRTLQLALGAVLFVASAGLGFRLLRTRREGELQAGAQAS